MSVGVYFFDGGVMQFLSNLFGPKKISPSSLNPNPDDSDAAGKMKGRSLSKKSDALEDSRLPKPVPLSSPPFPEDRSVLKAKFFLLIG